MNKYIEQNTIIEAFRKNCPNPTDLGNAQHFINIIRNIPAANVRPVIHGKWIIHTSNLFPAYSTIECDQCHAEQPAGIDDNFCPNCGADMRGE